MFIVQPSSKRKFRKLIRDPKLFFYDYFAKRISSDDFGIAEKQAFPVKNARVIQAPVAVHEKKKPDIQSKTANYIADVGAQVDQLVLYLMSHTCFVQFVPSPTPNAYRIAIKGGDLLYIVNCIRDYRNGKSSVKILTEKIQANHKGIIKCCMVDEEYEYYSPIIELDPWYHSSGRIYTHNWNPYITHVDEEYINKTVYSPHPYFLQGSPKIASLNAMLGLGRPIHHDPTFPVDVVYTWVDSNDPEWRKRRNVFSVNSTANAEDASDARFHQIDEIRYSLRSVASYFKEVGTIYLVTDSQVPWWLDISHPKIKIVDHKSLVI